MRIFDSVEHDNERILPALGSDYIFEIVVLLRRGDGDHALVRIVARQLVEFRSRQDAHGNSLPPAFIDHMLQAEIVTLLGDSHPGKSASSRLQRLGHRVDPVDVIHALVV